jgi:DNA-binding MarR family transcriptional regulator
VYNRPTVDENIGELAAELRISLGQILRRVRVEHSFPMGQGAVLGALDREGPKSISDLAASARMRPQSMAQTVRELEDRGLVARAPDPGDGRRSFISLTPEGLRHLEADRRQRDGWLAQVLSEDLSESERETIRAASPILRRIADS